MSLDWSIDAEAAGERLDRHVARHLDRPRNQVRRWIDEAHLLLNGRSAKPSTPLRAGDRVELTLPAVPPDPGLRAEPGELSVIWEDDDLAVLDKPAGLAVHPGAGRTSGTLAHFLLHRYPEMAGVGGPGRPGIVHRLDRDTTGVLVVARTDRAYRRLSEDFAARRVEKRYVAVVWGVPRQPAGRVELAIGRDPRDRKRMAVRPSGRPAETRWTRRHHAAGLSWLELELLTGRTHQIRVHLKAIGHPLVGDPTYGEARWRGTDRRLRSILRDFPRPALHAWRLGFAHPRSGEPVRFEALIPEDIRELWRAISELERIPKASEPGE